MNFKSVMFVRLRSSPMFLTTSCVMSVKVEDVEESLRHFSVLMLLAYRYIA